MARAVASTAVATTRSLRQEAVEALVATKADLERRIELARGSSDGAALSARVAALDAQAEAESADTVRLAGGAALAVASRPFRAGGRVVARLWSFYPTRQA